MKFLNENAPLIGLLLVAIGMAVGATVWVTTDVNDVRVRVSQSETNLVWEISKNTIGINENSAAIAANAVAIARNAEAIQRNAEAIDRNAKAIQRNAEAIDRNAAAIQRNAEAIDRNAAAIQRNAEAIDRNAAAIDRNGAAIDRNAVAIAANAAGIAEINRRLDRIEQRMDAMLEAIANLSATDDDAASPETVGTAAPAPTPASPTPDRRANDASLAAPK